MALPFIAGASIAAGGTIAASLGTAAYQEKNSEALQDRQFSYNNSVIDRGEKSFTSAGLPKFLYYNGSLSGQLPNTQTHLGGTAFAQSYGVNSNLPYYSSHPESQYLGLGKPRPTTVSSSDSRGDASKPGYGYFSSAGLDRPLDGTLGTTEIKTLDSSSGNDINVTTPKTIDDGGSSSPHINASSGLTDEEHSRFLKQLYEINNKGTQFSGFTRNAATQYPTPRLRTIAPTPIGSSKWNVVYP